MADAMRNVNMERLLTALIKNVEEFSSTNDPQDCEDQLHQLVTDLKDVASELKSCSSKWKATTREAEESAKQQAETSRELEQKQQEMNEEGEQLEQRRQKMNEEGEQLEQRRKKMDEEGEQLQRRESELKTKERLCEERQAELEKKEKLLEQQAAQIEQIEQDSRDEQARLEAEAAVIASDKSEVEQARSNLKQESEAAHNADIRRSNALRRREDGLKLTHQSVLALNETVNKSLAAVREEHDEDKRLLVVIQEKHQRMRALRKSLVQKSEACTRDLATISNGIGEIREVEARHAEVVAGLRKDITVLSTALDEQAEKARANSQEIQAADNDFSKQVAELESELSRMSTSIKKVTATSSQLDTASTEMEQVRSKIGNVTEASTRLEEVSTKIGNVNEVSAGLDEVSTKIGNVAEASTGLNELSAKFQQYQPATIETLQELTQAMSTARADVTKAQLDRSISRFETNQAKRGLGPISPEKPVSKHRRGARQSSVGATGMLTSFGPPQPLPENIEARIPSPRGQGRIVRVEATRPESGSPPPVRRRQAANPEPSSPRTLLQSSQSTVSVTAPPDLAKASDEIKNVWAHIDFPSNWTMFASNSLLQGFKRNTGKKVPEKIRPVGLMDSSSASPNCLLRRLQKQFSKTDKGDEKRCSACTKSDEPCVRATFVAEGLANVAYDAEREEKRWKLTLRED